jgi:hypothetical protein
MGTADDALIRLEKQSIKMDPTSVGLISCKTVRLLNRSDIMVLPFTDIGFVALDSSSRCFVNRVNFVGRHALLTRRTQSFAQIVKLSFIATRPLKSMPLKDYPLKRKRTILAT